MKKIDLDNWIGRPLFRQFSQLDIPYFSVTIQHDITALVARAKAMNTSLSSLLMFALTRAQNAVEAFQYRTLPDGQIVLHDQIDVVYLALREDKTITSVRVPYQPDYAAFDAARKIQEKNRGFA